MRVINTSVNTLSTRYLVIGFEGENERTQIRIDAASVFDEYPQASPSMAVKPGFGEEVYPVIVTKEGNEVVWDVTQDNLDFTGDGEIQLTFIKDNVICKTTIGKIRVNRSLIVNGDPPEHLDTWYEEATAKLADVDAAVYSLEALDATASGLPAGSSPTVEVQDVNDHKRLAFGIPKGDRGDRGPTGNGIRSISQSGSTGLYKKYTIHYTDGTTTTFQVRDGDRGLKGDTGATPDIGIGTVETLPAGSEATASMSGTAENPRLNLGIPKGDQGIQGEKGDKGDRGATPVFSMGAVTNLPAGSSATATITGTAEEPVLNLGIPKGDKGDKGDRGERGPQGIQGIQGDRGLTGPRGEQGQKGDKGDTGATGATGATPDFSIGTVSTLPAGSSATAEITGTAENPVLSLGIPQGVQGIQGEKGEKGDPGDGVPVGGLKGQVLAKASDADRFTEWINVAPVIKNEASGAIASFPDGADGHPVDELKVQIEPVQDLHGYDNPWPAGGGKNLIVPLDRSFTNNGVPYVCSASAETVSLKGTATNNGGRTGKLTKDIVLPAGTYTLSITAVSGTRQATYIVNRTDNNAYISTASFSLEEETSVYVGANVLGGTVYDEVVHIQIEAGSTATEWTPHSNICPIFGWDGVKVTRTGKNLNSYGNIEIGTTYSVELRNTAFFDVLKKLKPGTYTASAIYYARNDGAADIRCVFTNGKSTIYILRATERLSTGRQSLTFTIPEDVDWNAIFYINAYGGTSDGSTEAYIRDFQIEPGSTATDYETYAGNTYDIAFPSESGTVYGGELTVNADGSGSLVVDRASVDLGTLNWVIQTNYSVNRFGAPINDMTKATSAPYYDNILCSAYKPANIPITSVDEDCTIARYNGWVYLCDSRYSDVATFKDAASGVRFVYLLATPITYTLTASQIRTLLGQNNVWSDAGEVSVKYNADTKLYIDNKITQAIAAALNS